MENQERVTYSAWIVQGGFAGGAYHVVKNPIRNAAFEAWLRDMFGEPVIEDAETPYAAAAFCARNYGCFVPMDIKGAPGDE